MKKTITTKEAEKRLNNRQNLFSNWRDINGWGDLEKAKRLQYGIKKAMQSNSQIVLESEELDILKKFDWLEEKDNSPVRY